MTVVDGSVTNKAGTTYYLGGRVVTEAEYLKKYPIPKTVKVVSARRSGDQAWPIRSVGMACHPDQVTEANAALAARGIGARHEPDGRLLISDEAQRRECLKFRGLECNSYGGSV